MSEGERERERQRERERVQRACACVHERARMHVLPYARACARSGPALRPARRRRCRDTSNRILAPPGSQPPARVCVCVGEGGRQFKFSWLRMEGGDKSSGEADHGYDTGIPSHPMLNRPPDSDKTRNSPNLEHNCPIERRDTACTLLMYCYLARYITAFCCNGPGGWILIKKKSLQIQTRTMSGIGGKGQKATAAPAADSQKESRKNKSSCWFVGTQVGQGACKERQVRGLHCLRRRCALSAFQSLICKNS